MIANDSFPLRHLHRMHLIFSGNLPDRFDAHQRFQSNFGFEGTRVPLPLSSFAHGSAVLSSPAEPEKSNLGYCPKFGVHFSPGRRDACPTFAWLRFHAQFAVKKVPRPGPNLACHNPASNVWSAHVKSVRAGASVFRVLPLG